MENKTELKDILNKKISFINIERKVTDQIGNSVIEFMVWEDLKDTTDFVGYHMRYEIHKAYEVLAEFFKRKIPSNYFIFELKDSVILSELDQDTSIITDIVLKNTEEINKITLKLDDINFNNTLMQLIAKGTLIKDNNCEFFFSLNNLIFNKDNLNVSCRYFNIEDGFHTVYLYKLFANNVVVRTIEPLTDIDLAIENKPAENMFESVLNISDLNLKAHKLFINDVEVPNKVAVTFIHQELIIFEFTRLFNTQLALKIIDAIYYLLFEFKDDYYNFSRTPSDNVNYQDKVCTISTVYRMPSTKELMVVMEKYSINKSMEQLEEFLTEINSSYGKETFRIARDIFNELSEFSGNNLAIRVRLKKEALQKSYAIQGIRTHSLKTTLSFNEIFRSMWLKDSYMHSNNPNQVLNSYIFDSNIKLRTYQN